MAAPVWRTINAITLATVNMSASTNFYQRLGLFVTYGGPAADFTTLSSEPASNTSAMHVNLYSSSDYSPPPAGSWNKWGRCIFYVSDVDAMYRLALKEGFKPEMPPSDAPWGERGSAHRISA